ncbi:hypothetical protein V5O48_009508 [Marasmius crinis-equi]|uniref:Uncharacterized protein n=1 Tax=Marasmius crinis-equi TaxID=585013 RepID=A0ABR3FB40_9AGAR
MASVRNGEAEVVMVMEVTIRDQGEDTIMKHRYSQVISTVPLPGLATMDIPRNNLARTMLGHPFAQL